MVHQADLLNLIALEREQGVLDRLGKTDQGGRSVTHLITRFVPDDFDVAHRDFQIRSADPVAGRAEDGAVLRQYIHSIRA